MSAHPLPPISGEDAMSVTTAVIEITRTLRSCPSEHRARVLATAWMLYVADHVGEGEGPSGCRMGRHCERHGVVHGAEAEELREALEGFDSELYPEVRLLLDRVDARDSLAYREATGR